VLTQQRLDQLEQTVAAIAVKIQFHSIFLYLCANFTPKGQLRSEHEKRKEKPQTPVRFQKY
jgi:hypothetical protein